MTKKNCYNNFSAKLSTFYCKIVTFPITNLEYSNNIIIVQYVVLYRRALGRRSA